MQILSFLTYTFELLPFLICTIFLKRIFSSNEGKAFFFYTLVYAIFISLVLVFRYLLVNIPVTSILRRLALLFEFNLLCIYYYQIILNQKFRFVFVCATMLFTLFCFYDFYTSTERQNSFLPLAIQCLFFILLITYSFYEKIRDNLSTPVYQLMNFWVSTALLLYFSGNFFLFLYSKTAIKNEVFKFQYNIVYDFFTIIKDILLCIAVVMNNHSTQDKDTLNIQADVNDILDFVQPSNKKANF